MTKKLQIDLDNCYKEAKVKHMLNDNKGALENFDLVQTISSNDALNLCNLGDDKGALLDFDAIQRNLCKSFI